MREERKAKQLARGVEATGPLTARSEDPGVSERPIYSSSSASAPGTGGS